MSVVALSGILNQQIGIDVVVERKNGKRRKEDEEETTKWSAANINLLICKCWI